MMIMMERSERGVRVGREKLKACMTCPLCHHLFTEATTISECLHTFCRKCIYEKITEEELESCPVCNIELGCTPLEKLRADHSLQDLRAKLFPHKRKRDNPTDDFPSASFPAKRKERSLSSLVISEPRASSASTQPRMTERRKNPSRKTLTVQASTLSVKNAARKEDDSLKSSSSSKALNKIIPNRKQIESSNRQMHDNGVDDAEGRDDLWTPLNSLLDAASKTKPDKFNSQENFVSSTFPDATSNNETRHQLKPKANENCYKSKANGVEKRSNPPAPSVSVRRRRMQGVRQRRPSASERLNISAQAVVDSNSKNARRFNPIWFSLIASSNQAGGAPLPQISKCYLRVKDGSLPASYIKKYLVEKLNLSSEAEVEIWLRGQPVISTIQLHHLVELWLQTAPLSERIQTSVGSPGKDFVMVLSYGRKPHPM